MFSGWDFLWCSLPAAPYDPGVEKEARTALHPAWGLAAAGFYLTHAITLIRVGEAPHLLWSCHLGCLVLAGGIWLRRPALEGIALMWLATGLPTWIATVLSDADFFQPTSVLTHVFGLALAAVAVRASGMPRGTWWRAFLGLAALWIATRLVLPVEHNVNVTRDYWFGWEAKLMSFPVFIGSLALVVGIVFRGLEGLVRAAGWRTG